MRLALLIYCCGAEQNVMRCIDSIVQQHNSNVTVVTIFESEQLCSAVLNNYGDDWWFRYRLKGKKTVRAHFNEIIKDLQAEYFMVAKSDQTFARGCFDSLLPDLFKKDGAIVNYSTRAKDRPAFSKVFAGGINIGNFFSTSPYMWNMIYKTELFRKYDCYITDLNPCFQTLTAAKYLSYVTNILYSSGVMFYRDSAVNKTPFTYMQMLDNGKEIISLMKRMKKAKLLEGVFALKRLYALEFTECRYRVSGIKNKLRFYSLGKKMMKIADSIDYVGAAEKVLHAAKKKIG